MSERKIQLPGVCTGRCWFAYYGWVGSSAPTCRKCGRPNPNYRPEDDPHYKEPPVDCTPPAGC